MTAPLNENPTERIAELLKKTVGAEMLNDVLASLSGGNEALIDLEGLECLMPSQGIDQQWNEHAANYIFNQISYQLFDELGPLFLDEILAEILLYWMDLRSRLEDDKKEELDSIVVKAINCSASGSGQPSIEAILYKKLLEEDLDEEAAKISIESIQAQLTQKFQNGVGKWLKHEVVGQEIGRERDPSQVSKETLEQISERVEDEWLRIASIVSYLPDNKVNPSTHPVIYLYLIGDDLEKAVRFLRAKQVMGFNEFPEEEAFNTSLLHTLHTVEEALRSIKPGVYANSDIRYRDGAKRAIISAQRLKDILL